MAQASANFNSLELLCLLITLTELLKSTECSESNKCIVMELFGVLSTELSSHFGNAPLF